MTERKSRAPVESSLAVIRSRDEGRAASAHRLRRALRLAMELDAVLLLCRSSGRVSARALADVLRGAREVHAARGALGTREVTRAIRTGFSPRRSRVVGGALGTGRFSKFAPRARGVDAARHD